MTRRIACFSRRNFDSRMFQCFLYEFEDVLAAVEQVEFIAPAAAPPAAMERYKQRTLNKLRRWTGRLEDLHGEVRPRMPDGPFDLFVFPSLFAHYLPLLDKLPWRRMCAKGIVILPELWSRDLALYRRQLAYLSGFDHVIVMNPRIVDAVASISGRPVTCILPGIDADRFSPETVGSARPIDVFSIGRNESEVHSQLLAMTAADPRFFYHHDTARNFLVTDWRQHRDQLANLMRRSQFALCHRHPYDDIPLPRVFEAAAAGAIPAGYPSGSPELKACFPSQRWFVDLQAGSVAGQLQSWRNNPEGVGRLRQELIRESLRRHDWGRRWQSILEAIGLPATPRLLQRLERHQTMADSNPVGVGRGAGGG
jgi:glycosyltransferase involved in cell wall biosynthesis